MSNALAKSLSLYLRQHADNPVNWREWSPAVFDTARSEDKPVFVSIGYSACHWCHVMADESFSDLRTAALLNERFINVKVDREQRPDLDQIFMEAVQLMTGQGGWPLSVFLTPRGEPFFGGTYWPLQRRGPIPSFSEVLMAVDAAWRNQRSRVEEQAGVVTRAILESRLDRPSSGDNRKESLASLRQHVILKAEEELAEAFDPVWGGFGRAPKFPQALLLRWLVRRAAQTQRQDLIAMAEKTLELMARGGIYDHVGGGFHRYSTDAQWLVPHFEKMLYDNATLAAVYAEAWQAFGNPFYAKVASETCEYIIRDLRSPEGAFFGSEDADSEHQEGRFYLWTPDEISEAIGDRERAARFCRIFGVDPGGNFEGKTILHLRQWPVANQSPSSADFEQWDQQIAADRKKLYLARDRRVRPTRDDKLIACWNGLAIEALATCARMLSRPDWLLAAVAAAEFAVCQMISDNGRVRRCLGQGRAEPYGFLDDYAALAIAMLALQHETGHDDWLHHAQRLIDAMLRLFGDSSGGFYYTAGDHEPLIARKKDVIDTAEPSGNGLAVTALLEGARATGNQSWIESAEKSIFCFGPWLKARPTASPQMLLALSMYSDRQGDRALE